MNIDTQTLIKWDEGRVPRTPEKQWYEGWLFILFAVCAILLFIFHNSLPFPYPVTPILFLGLALFFYVLGVKKYNARKSQWRNAESHCPHCGKQMEEYVVEMRSAQLPRAPLSKIELLHRYLIKEKLFEGHDGRIYMVGKKNYAPGAAVGSASWKRTGFLLNAKWRVCRACQYSFLQDTIFETVAKTEEEIEALIRDKEEID
jgi:hypothetical protein